MLCDEGPLDESPAARLLCHSLLRSPVVLSPVREDKHDILCVASTHPSLKKAHTTTRLAPQMHHPGDAMLPPYRIQTPTISYPHPPRPILLFLRHTNTHVHIHTCTPPLHHTPGQAATAAAAVAAAVQLPVGPWASGTLQEARTAGGEGGLMGGQQEEQGGQGGPQIPLVGPQETQPWQRRWGEACRRYRSRLGPVQVRHKVAC